SPTGARTVTSFGTVELTVYPYECDAYGHLNQAALLTLLERARWDALARGPGMDLFDRNGVWPAVRKATIEYRAPAFARDLLRVETTVAAKACRCSSCTAFRSIGRCGDTSSLRCLVFGASRRTCAEWGARGFHPGPTGTP